MPLSIPKRWQRPEEPDAYDPPPVADRSWLAYWDARDAGRTR